MMALDTIGPTAKRKGCQSTEVHKWNGGRNVGGKCGPHGNASNSKCPPTWITMCINQFHGLGFLKTKLGLK